MLPKVWSRIRLCTSDTNNPKRVEIDRLIRILINPRATFFIFLRPEWLQRYTEVLACVGVNEGAREIKCDTKSVKAQSSNMLNKFGAK